MNRLSKLEKQCNKANELCALEIQKAKDFQAQGDIAKAGKHFAEAQQYAEIASKLFWDIAEIRGV